MYRTNAKQSHEKKTTDKNNEYFVNITHVKLVLKETKEHSRQNKAKQMTEEKEQKKIEKIK